jgi:hypothetical protein
MGKNIYMNIGIVQEPQKFSKIYYFEKYGVKILFTKSKIERIAPKIN